MSHHHTQPDKRGAANHGHAPQVAVRDGNRLLCPCCGQVLMELSDDGPEDPPHETKQENPWLAIRADGKSLPSKLPTFSDVLARRQDALKEAAWQAFEQAQEAEQEKRHAQYLASDDPKFCADYLTQPIDPEVAAYDFPEEDPQPLPGPKRPRPSRTEISKPRRRRENPWQDVRLEPPYSYQEKRYLAWTFYHLKIQDLELQEKILAKQAKIENLRRELDCADEMAPYEEHLPSEYLPKVRLQVEVVEFDLLHWINHVQGKGVHVDQDHVVTCGMRLNHPSYPKERGPP